MYKCIQYNFAVVALSLTALTVHGYMFNADKDFSKLTEWDQAVKIRAVHAYSDMDVKIKEGNAYDVKCISGCRRAAYGMDGHIGDLVLANRPSVDPTVAYVEVTVPKGSIEGVESNDGARITNEGNVFANDKTLSARCVDCHPFVKCLNINSYSVPELNIVGHSEQCQFHFSGSAKKVTQPTNCHPEVHGAQTTERYTPRKDPCGEKTRPAPAPYVPGPRRAVPRPEPEAEPVVPAAPAKPVLSQVHAHEGTMVMISKATGDEHKCQFADSAKALGKCDSADAGDTSLGSCELGADGVLNVKKAADAKTAFVLVCAPQNSVKEIHTYNNGVLSLKEDGVVNPNKLVMHAQGCSKTCLYISKISTDNLFFDSNSAEGKYSVKATCKNWKCLNATPETLKNPPCP